MARIAGVIVPGDPHHIPQRGNRRQKVFFCDDDYLVNCESARWMEMPSTATHKQANTVGEFVVKTVLITGAGRGIGAKLLTISVVSVQMFASTMQV